MLNDLGKVIKSHDGKKERLVSNNAIQMFSSQDLSGTKDLPEWTEDWFNSDNLPDCGLNLTYPDFDKIEWKSDTQSGLELVEINITDILDRFSLGGYNLDAWKYFNIRQELAKNSKENPFYYPEVTLGSDGKFHLGQGRHRLNVLHKIYGIKTLLVEVI